VTYTLDGVYMYARTYEEAYDHHLLPARYREDTVNAIVSRACCLANVWTCSKGLHAAEGLPRHLLCSVEHVCTAGVVWARLSVV
jgi:hypothetical protein